MVHSPDADVWPDPFRPPSVSHETFAPATASRDPIIRTSTTALAGCVAAGSFARTGDTGKSSITAQNAVHRIVSLRSLNWGQYSLSAAATRQLRQGTEGRFYRGKQGHLSMT